MIPRIYDLDKLVEPNKVIVLLGPRRVGKTTLLRTFLAKTKLKYREALGDELYIQEALSAQNLDDLSKFIGDNKLLVIDEAQRIPNIGLNLKIIVDNIPGIHVVATGSSSFELTGQTGEPLTGRKKTLILYPVSMLELKKNTSSFDLKRFLPERLVFGSYPQIITSNFKKRNLLF